MDDLIKDFNEWMGKVIDMYSRFEDKLTADEKLKLERFRKSQQILVGVEHDEKA